MYAKNGWHTKACSCEYALFAALSMLIAGILSEISGIFVVESDRGNIFSLNFCAPLGDIKYEQKPKAFSSLCNATSSTLVFESAFLIHFSLG